LYLLLNVEQSIPYKDVVQSLINHVSLWCLFFDPHLPTHQSIIGIEWIQKKLLQT
jgi:hypothetical protein